MTSLLDADGTEVMVVLVTAPSSEKAAEIARALVEERLAACGTILEGARSIYRWEGQVQDEREALLIVKSSRDRLQALVDRIGILHPYEVPEIMGLSVAGGSRRYLDWIAESTR
ncbi:MAG TPA: divalent-cation tolerance protein CutA [Anaeromyxobacteraceae bacterium]|nr:divalent-cation tolerance protein CutA [Anaeromyxobacteraceae bacterium]